MHIGIAVVRVAKELWGSVTEREERLATLCAGTSARMPDLSSANQLKNKDVCLYVADLTLNQEGPHLRGPGFVSDA